LFGSFFIGEVIDKSSDGLAEFRLEHLTLIGTLALGLLISVLLCYIDETNDRKLNNPP
jgi:hypothetical protein